VKTEAAILWGLHEPWSVEEIELDAPHYGEIQVRLAASGLCHSDDHCVKGDLIVGMPIIGGHEGAGIVEEVGPGVTRLKEAIMWCWRSSPPAGTAGGVRAGIRTSATSARC